MEPAQILIIEDDIPLRQTLKKVLQRQGFTVAEAEGVQQATARLADQAFDLILLDLRLPDGNGLDILKEYSHQYRDQVVILTGTGTIHDAVDAMKNGAYDFITKPVDRDLLLATLNKALEIRRQMQSCQTLKAEFGQGITFSQIVHQSKAVADTIAVAKKLAVTDNSILIEGETGTGKELLAQAIHRHSRRREQVFIPLNCASIPETLAESELFGFNKGAFTDARSPYAGKFLLANQGTIFLDEISELPMSIQGKLLRVLESGEITPLKSDTPTRVDVRIIAATNCDLEQRMRLQQFRKDLFYRIEQSRIQLPPLRERPMDIPPLVNHFLNLANITLAKNISGIATEAMDLLLAYPWPGNVRELKNTILETAALIPGSEIRVEHLPVKLRKKDAAAALPLPTLAELELQHIRRVMQAVGGNHTQAAKKLGISRASLYRKLKNINAATD